MLHHAGQSLTVTCHADRTSFFKDNRRYKENLTGHLPKTEQSHRMKEIQELSDRLGLRFHDPSLLLRAVTHSSYLNENPHHGLEDNERLEFLGDAVLDFVVGDYLYHHFPEMNEGNLTKLRAALVRTETLATFASQFEMGRALRLSQGEAENGGRERPATLCGAFEALAGALYLDQGLDAVIAFMQTLVPAMLNQILKHSLHKDAKSEFQIWAQARFNITPHYQVIRAEGPDHNKRFTVEVLLEASVWGQGTGRNKQGAEQEAARAALIQADDYDDLAEEGRTGGQT